MYNSSAYYYDGRQTFNSGSAPIGVSMSQAHYDRRVMVTPSQALAPINFQALQTCKPRLAPQSYAGASSLYPPSVEK
jgi:hypothetical protein